VVWVQTVRQLSNEMWRCYEFYKKDNCGAYIKVLCGQLLGETEENNRTTEENVCFGPYSKERR